MVAFMGNWGWIRDPRRQATHGAGIDAKPRGKAKRREANKRARRARRQSR